MKLTSIVTLIALSVAAVVAVPVTDNAPAKLHRRAACDELGQVTMDKLQGALTALLALEYEYYRVVRNPTLGLLFAHAKENLNIIMFEIKDELGDPVDQRSESLTLDRQSENFDPTWTTIHTKLTTDVTTTPGSSFSQALNNYAWVSRKIKNDIDALVNCWNLAAGN